MDRITEIKYFSSMVISSQVDNKKVVLSYISTEKYKCIWKHTEKG